MDWRICCRKLKLLQNSNRHMFSSFDIGRFRPMQTGHLANHQKHGMEKLKIVQEFIAVANGMMIRAAINFLLFAEFPVLWWEISFRPQSPDEVSFKSNCVDIPEIEKSQCGYPGVSENVCMWDLNCCYNGADIVGISCYHPRGRKWVSQTSRYFASKLCHQYRCRSKYFNLWVNFISRTGGMSPGGAAALTSIIWIVLFGGFIIYYTMFSGPTAGSGGISNPLA